jgi:predicted esterase
MGFGPPPVNLRFLSLLCFVLMSVSSAKGDDFFDINHIRYCGSQPESGPAVFKQVDKIDQNNNKTQVPVFEPFIEVRISAKDSVKSSSVMGKIYFYDDNKQLIATATKPDLAVHDDNQQYDWPVILSKDKDQFIYFAVPDKVLAQADWSALAVFGDAKGVDAQLYGAAGDQEVTDYSFPEKALIEDKNGPPIERKTTMDPIIEHVVQTYNYKQPQITLFLRPPLGMTDASQAKGVLAMSLLAGNVDGVKRQLQGMDAVDQLSGPLRFAEEHKLIVLCWGSSGLWDPTKNWDDQSADTTYETDKDFDQIAEAWSRGVQELVKEYGIPANNYLLWGESGSAQYACRLALRKPEYFLAIHAHIPSSFDKPTPEGARVLWCLTTGELESGHARSLRFYKQCRELGYPITYKAVTGLGHAWSPISADLGLKFFAYALTVADQRTAYDKSLADPLAQFQAAQTSGGSVQPWLESFRKPAYVGDIVNQEMFSYAQVDMVPAGFRTPLPTKDIADAWNK